jgi:hypothetical protein
MEQPSNEATERPGDQNERDNDSCGFFRSKRRTMEKMWWITELRGSVTIPAGWCLEGCAE